MTESCFEFEECGAYAAEYPIVLDVEYTDDLGSEGFADACDDPDHPAVVILRDHSLVTPGHAEYVYRSCA